MNIRKAIVAAVSCASLVFGLSACSSSSTSSESLDFMTGLGEGPLLNAVKEMTKDFEKANPSIKINVIAAGSDLEQEIKVRLASNNAPDMWNTHGWSRDRYSEFLEPLQNQSWASKLSPAIATSIEKSDKSFYALPMDVIVTGILYNADVLEKAGVDPKDIKTWDDFDAACVAIKKTGADCIGGAAKDNLTVGHIADYLATGTYTEKQEKDLKAGKFDTAVWEKVAGTVAGWKDKGYFNKDYVAAANTDLQKYMASDKLAFTMQMNGFASSVQSFNAKANIGFMPLPSQNGGDSYLISGEDFAVGVSNKSKHKEEALKYLDFLAKGENVKKMSKVLSAAPGLTEVDSDLGMLNDSYKYWVEEQKVSTQPFFDRVYLPNGMWDTICTSTDGVVTGQSTPSVAAEQMKTQFESLYGKNS